MVSGPGSIIRPSKPGAPACSGSARRLCLGKQVRRLFFVFLSALLVFCSKGAPEKHLEIRDKKMVSDAPPFTVVLPSEFQFIDFSSIEYPDRNSRTRTYLFIVEKNKQAEALLIVQVADKTDPAAEPISVPPLIPDGNERMYNKGEREEGKRHSRFPDSDDRLESRI